MNINARRSTIALLLLYILKITNGHGYIKSPRSRNYVASQDGKWSGGGAEDPAMEDCPQCLNLGGTLARCGTTSGRNYDTPKNFLGGDLPTNIQDTYLQGADVDFEVVLTAHHKGHFEYKACPIQEGDVPTQACFDSNPLEFVRDNLYEANVDTNYPERAYIPLTTHPNLQYVTGSLSGSFYSHRFQLPPNLSGDLVLIQWHYVTANSCMGVGYVDYNWPAENFHPGNLSNCGPLPPDGNGVPEQFWNCAEVKIVSTSPTMPISTPVIPPVTVPVTSPHVTSPVEAPVKDPVTTPISQPTLNVPTSSANCPPLFDPFTTYNAGEIVALNGNIYQCKSYPYSGWCSNPGYEPGTSLYWNNAWEIVGDCTSGPTSPVASPVSLPTAPVSTPTNPVVAPVYSPVQTPTSPVIPPTAPVSIPTYPVSPPTHVNIGGTAEKLEVALDASKIGMNANLFVYQTPLSQWVPSTVYQYDGFIKGLRLMYESGVAGTKFYIGDSSAKGEDYGLVNIAAFLAQSMKETIQYDACDENSWDLYNGKYPLSNACGQLSQSYQNYHCSAEEAHMECAVQPDMKITATTNAKWYGAPGPLKCGPKSVYPSTGYWDYSMECDKSWANPPSYCTDYPEQKAGGENNDAPIANRNGRTDVEGCCWWGRGVIQTTGVCNFGKLNYFLGKRASDEGRESAYPTVDFCKDPGAICASSEFQELKWIAGMFYWMESVQAYDREGWNYMEKLHEFVDGGMKDSAFIDAVSGIVNRGCHNPPCATGALDGGAERRSNFQKCLTEFSLI